MTVTQTAKTSNSFTITIEGMPNSADRQTWISLFPPYETGSYYTLSQAQSLGYITFDAGNLDNNNGNIKITFSSSHLANHRVCRIVVEEWYSGSPYNEVVIPCSVGFAFENSQTKSSGDDIDITVGDMRKITLFFNELYAAYEKENPSYTNNFNGIVTGNPIYKYYLTTPLDNIFKLSLKPSVVGSPEFDLTTQGLSAVDLLEDVSDGLSVSNLFYAKYFNNIKNAINNFYLTNSN